VFGLGLVGKLLALPYSLPKAGIAYCFEKVLEMAEAEYYDDQTVKEELLLLQLKLEEGEIDEMEYRRQEAPLLIWLREIKEHRKQLIEQAMADRITEGESGRVVIDLPDEVRDQR
jgi:hypothetical protein